MYPVSSRRPAGSGDSVGFNTRIETWGGAGMHSLQMNARCSATFTPESAMVTVPIVELSYGLTDIRLRPKLYVSCQQVPVTHDTLESTPIEIGRKLYRYASPYESNLCVTAQSQNVVVGINPQLLMCVSVLGDKLAYTPWRRLIRPISVETTDPSQSLATVQIETLLWSSLCLCSKYTLERMDLG